MRHGLLGLVLAFCFLTIPSLQSAFVESLSGPAERPIRYVVGALIILAALSAYTWRISQQWGAAQFGWIVYLGALSVWEEWVFRLAIPQVLEGVGASVWLAVVLSAILFGALHYFTLRWKWQWCVSAALGGLYFSYQMELHGDLLLVAGIHWVATSLNTPRPPAPSVSSDA